MIGDDLEKAWRWACHEAANDDLIFAAFKRLTPLQGVVENVEEEWGNVYSSKLGALAEKWIERGGAWVEDMSQLGSPVHVMPCRSRVLTPTVVRFLCRAEWLAIAFELRGKSIIEIGGGYGALAALVSRFCQPASYAIIDLEEPRQLQERFLKAAGVEGVKFWDFSWLGDGSDCVATGHCDLLVSDFALSELDPTERDAYARLLFPRATSGALVWNRGPAEGWQLKDMEVAAWLEKWLAHYGKRIWHEEDAWYWEPK